MIQPYDIPERMIAGAPPGYYMERKLSKPGIGLDFLHPDAFAEYIRCFTGKTIRGSCEDYRACASCEFEMDEPDYSAGRKIECPLLVTWGAKSHTGTVHGDVLSRLRPLCPGGSTETRCSTAFMRHFKS